MGGWVAAPPYTRVDPAILRTGLWAGEGRRAAALAVRRLRLLGESAPAGAQHRRPPQLLVRAVARYDRRYGASAGSPPPRRSPDERRTSVLAFPGEFIPR